jgi:26S proteasome regulatory subunit N2
MLVSLPLPRLCRCFADGQYQQAVGIALESRRLDKLEEAILASEDVTSTLAYSLKVAQTLVASRHYRQEVRSAVIWPFHAP